MSEQLATRPEGSKKTPALVDKTGVKFADFNQMWQFAICCVNSQIYKDVKTPEVACIKMQAGMELGLTPVWSLANVMVVNGIPSVWGDAMLGIVKAHKECVDVIETDEGRFPDDSFAAVCEVQRRDKVPVIRRFSVADAKKAGLFTKSGPWSQYPRRMLQMRARAFACRDAFADALRGFGVVEDLQDVDQSPRSVRGRTVSTQLVLPDEPVTHAQLDQKLSDDAVDESVANMKAADAEQAASEPTNEKGEFVF